MELHLHLNVFMGGMFLSAGLKVGGHGGFKSTDNKCGGLSERSAEVVKVSQESCVSGRLVVYKLQHRSHATRGFSVFAERKDKFVP